MRCDLLKTAFVSSSSDNASDLYAQYISNLSYVLDQHAPLKTNVLPNLSQYGKLSNIVMPNSFVDKTKAPGERTPPLPFQ